MRTRHHAPAIALILLVACETVTGPDEGLVVSITTSRELVSATQPVSITVTVVNRSPWPARVPIHCGPHFVVLDQQENRVGPAGRICSLIAHPPRTVAPGESFTFQDRWSGDGGEADALPAHRLAPGTYRIVGRVLAGPSLRASKRWFLLTSEALPIAVLAEPMTT